LLAIDRRTFHKGLAAAALATALPTAVRAEYRGPNVILVRFGGGVRRAETVVPGTTYAPFLVHNLIPRGAFIPDLRIAQLDGVATSHAEGTLNLLTGRYLAYRDAGSGFLQDRLEPTEPTLFEYLRDSFAIPAHQTLLINGEDRPLRHLRPGRDAEPVPLQALQDGADHRRKCRSGSRAESHGGS
jgi:hypothetical protein